MILCVCVLKCVGMNEATQTLWIAEAYQLVVLGAPICLTFFLSVGVQMATQIIVGHVSSDALAAAALATMFAHAFGLSIILGAASACDTLCSQAFGARSYRKVGVVAYQGCLIGLGLATLVGLCWYSLAAPFFALMGQDEDIARLASQYLRLLLIGLPASTLFETLKKPLNAANITTPGLCFSAMSLFSSALLGYLLVYHSPLSFWGAPVASALSHWLTLLAFLLYLRNHRLLHRYVDGSSAAGPTAPVAALAAASAAPVQEGERVGAKGGLAAQCAGAEAGSLEMVAGGYLEGSSDLSMPGAALAPVEEGERTGADGGLAAHSAAAGAALAPVEEGERTGAKGGLAAYSAAAGAVDTELVVGAALPGGTGDGGGGAAAAATAAVVVVAAHPAFHDLLDELFPMPTLAELLSASGALTYIKLGAPGAAMLFVEWGAYEGLSLIAGTISRATLAAQSIMATSATLSFMPFLGLSVAACIRVGNSLGELSPAKARRSYHVAMALSGVLMAINTLVVLSARSYWAQLFTDDEEVAQLVSGTMFLLALYTLFDGIQCVSCGVLKGLSLPGPAAAVNVLSYLAVGLPLAYFLANPAGMGLHGIWLAFSAAVLTASLCMTGLLVRVDWEAKAKEAQERGTAPTGGH